MANDYQHFMEETAEDFGVEMNDIVLINNGPDASGYDVIDIYVDDTDNNGTYWHSHNTGMEWNPQWKEIGNDEWDALFH